MYYFFLFPANWSLIISSEPQINWHLSPSAASTTSSSLVKASSVKNWIFLVNNKTNENNEMQAFRC